MHREGVLKQVKMDGFSSADCAFGLIFGFCLQDVFMTLAWTVENVKWSPSAGKQCVIAKKILQGSIAISVSMTTSCQAGNFELSSGCEVGASASVLPSAFADIYCNNWRVTQNECLSYSSCVRQNILFTTETLCLKIFFHVLNSLEN